MSNERGIVVASDFGCTCFVIETIRGYALLRMWGYSSPIMEWREIVAENFRKKRTLAEW